MSDLYRKNVGIVVANTENKVLVCNRADCDKPSWQFPQGGIEEGESVVTAARRELYEETGLTNVEIVKIADKPLRYDFPADILARFKKLGRTNSGQEQYWVLVRFSGNDKEINFNTKPDEIEFKAYEWVDIEEAVNRIVAFKKDVYKQVAKMFKPFLL